MIAITEAEAEVVEAIEVEVEVEVMRAEAEVEGVKAIDITVMIDAVNMIIEEAIVVGRTDIAIAIVVVIIEDINIHCLL